MIIGYIAPAKNDKSITIFHIKSIKSVSNKFD